jgi:hypothetical protein
MLSGLAADREGSTQGAALRSDPRWQLIERVAASPHFSRSSRLCDFIKFVTQETLLGRGEQLNEQRIGVNVFERRVDYDSTEDNIVRSHASRLRQRLEAYFAAEGRNESLRVTLPRGSYVPRFENAREASPQETPVQPSVVDNAVSFSGVKHANRIVWILIIAASLAVGYLLSSWRRADNAARNSPGESAAMHALWSEIFPQGKRTLIIPADSSLVLFENLTGKTVSLQDYMNKAYLNGEPTIPSAEPAEIAKRLAHRRLTSIADLELTAQLLRIPEAIAAKPQIRFARDLQMADLKEANAILIGAQESDPWLSMFQAKRNFVISDDQNTRVFTVLNRSPRPGELREYHYEPRDPKHTAYALIALTPNLGGTGMVLIVEGTTIAGTEAAADFLTDQAATDSVLAPAFRQYGRVPPFEILLETTNLDGSAPQAKVVAVRTYQ